MSERDKLRPMLPTYEMVLKSGESPDESPQYVRFEKNDSAIIKCSLGDSGFDTNTLQFSKAHENITKERTSTSYSYIIKNYKPTFQPINFDCRAKRLSGKEHIRRMHIFPKTDKTIPLDAEQCTSDVGLECYNEGFCVKHKNDDKPYCICTRNFAGPNCQHLVIETVVFEKTHGRMTENILYSSIAFLAVIALIFAILFSREKVKRMRTKRQLRESIIRRPMIHQHETSSLQHYDFCDGSDPESGYLNVNKEMRTTDIIISEYDNLTPEQNRRLGRDRLLAVSTTPDAESPTPPISINGLIRNGGILKKSINEDHLQNSGGILKYSPIIKPPLARQAPLASDL